MQIELFSNSLQNCDQDFINILPEETLQYIFSFVLSSDPKDLPSLLLTCRQWKKISADPYLLTHIYKSYFVDAPVLLEEKNEKWPLILIKDLIQNVNTIIEECKYIDSCKKLIENLPIDNISPKNIGELSELRDLHNLYNLEILFSTVINEDHEWKNQIDYETLTNREKLAFIRERLQESLNEKKLHLILSNKNLTSLPPEIGLFTHLKMLDLQGNHLTILPPEIGQLINLKSIYLSNNQLSCLPSELGMLAKLETLQLDKNKLRTLPSEISSLSHLKKLCVSENQLVSLPSEIGKLSKLEELSLDKNKLTSLPPEICRLNLLKQLYLSENQLESLPSEIGKLSELEELSLDKNKLTSLPPEIANIYHHLEFMTVDIYKFTSLPTKLGDLSELKKMYLFIKIDKDNNKNSPYRKIEEYQFLDLIYLNQIIVEEIFHISETINCTLF